VSPDRITKSADEPFLLVEIGIRHNKLLGWTLSEEISQGQEGIDPWL
jgi:hypothetical protein